MSTGSVITGSGSQTRGARSEIRQDPHQFNRCPDPTEGAYSAPPDPLAVFRGLLLKGGKGKGEKGKKGEKERGRSSSFALGRKKKSRRLCHQLTPHIMLSYTHKMAIVSRP